MTTENLNTAPEENLTGEITGALSNLERDVIEMNQPKKNIPHKATDTEYHIPGIDQFREQQFSDNVENSSNDEIKETEKKMKDFLEVRDIIKSDNGRYLTKDFNAISGRLEYKRDEVLECRGKYKEMNEPKPKFLPFLLGSLGYNSLKDKNDYLSVVDFSMDAKSNRLFLINMKTNEVEINTTCMQGQGKNGVQTFSNKNGSYQSSIGLMQISSERNPEDGSRYGGVQPYKENDEKLIVYGKEEGFNDNVHARYIYMHTGDASKGCFTLPQNNIGHDILRKMAFGGVIMSFYPDAEYLKKTNLLS